MALKGHRILMVDLLKKEIAANGWLTACSSEEADRICRIAVRFNRKGFGAEAIGCIASVIGAFSDTEDSLVDIADKLVNKCCWMLPVDEGDSSRLDGK